MYGAIGPEIHSHFLCKRQKLEKDSSIVFFVLQSVIERQARKAYRLRFPWELEFNQTVKRKESNCLEKDPKMKNTKSNGQCAQIVMSCQNWLRVQKNNLLSTDSQVAYTRKSSLHR